MTSTDLFADITETDRSIRFTLKTGVEWKDANAYLEREYPEPHWIWRKFDDIIVLMRKSVCECEECVEEDEEEEEDREENIPFPPAFQRWVDGMTRKDLYRAIWNRGDEKTVEIEEEEPPASFFKRVEGLERIYLYGELWSYMSDEEKKELEEEDE